MNETLKGNIPNSCEHNPVLVYLPKVVQHCHGRHQGRCMLEVRQMKKLANILLDIVSIPAFIFFFIVAMIYAGILFIVELKESK